jgi:hypothetical protein
MKGAEMRWTLRFHHGDRATDHTIEEGVTQALPEIPDDTHSVTLLPEAAPPPELPPEPHPELRPEPTPAGAVTEDAVPTGFPAVKEGVASAEAAGLMP